MTRMLPLTKLVGLDPAIQALLLLAIEPRLRGAVFAAPAGTGKSSLARGFAALTRDRGSGRFIELPPAADEEALLGGIDLQATLRCGQRVARAGLLAQANGGTLHADQINLLSDAAVNLVLGALDAGEVKVEREGLSLRAPAQFTLLGSYDPGEGQPRRHLLDRVGLWVNLPAQTDAAVRRAVVRANLWAEGPQTIGDGFHSSAQDADLELLQNLVAMAQTALPGITISDQQIEQLAAAALAFGVEGHRADGFAVATACAAAAFSLRDAVEQADLELAVRLVILPRATQLPQPDAQDQAPQSQPQSTQDQARENEHQPTDQSQRPDEQVFSALMTELPAELTALPFKALRRGKTGSRGTVAGKRGRHIRSVAGDLRRGKIDVPATLRAAAPWQVVRQSQGETRPRRTVALLPRAHAPTLPFARSRLLHIRAEDLRIKQFKSKAGALFLFAVDASGSMALHRMRQAKGAVHTLLQRAYVHRDRVALLAFRGETAELLLPPSQSVELARRALDLLPTGGGTPVAAALLAALDVAKQARGRGIMQTVLVLLTDGRANIGLRTGRDGLVSELQTLGRQVAEAGIQALVIDTQRSYLSRGEARKLAEYLGGEYLYLPNASGEAIAAMAAGGVTR